jgi:tryptophan synthase alpha chain
MPYSDPLADGPVIQHSSEVAIKNGMSIKHLFEQLKDIRSTVDVPLVLMGYFNPILQYGVERFCKDAAAVGIDGMIIPDLPLREYLELYKPFFEANNLRNVFLISPQSEEERIRMIDDNTDGFIYLVSSAATTGNSLQMGTAQEAYFKRIADMQLKNPTLVGFGIGDKTSFQAACKHSRGAIIGTAFIKAIEQARDLKEAIKGFVEGVR